MDDTSTSVCDAMNRLKVVIVSLSRELNKVLDDAVYMSMSASQMQAYDEKRNELRRLVRELAQLHQIQLPRLSQQPCPPEQSVLMH